MNFLNQLHNIKQKLWLFIDRMLYETWKIRLGLIATFWFFLIICTICTYTYKYLVKHSYLLNLVHQVHRLFNAQNKLLYRNICITNEQPYCNSKSMTSEIPKLVLSYQKNPTKIARKNVVWCMEELTGIMWINFSGFY